MSQRKVETYNVYVRYTRYEGIYDVRIPELAEEVFEVTGSFYLPHIIENCVKALVGTDKFNLQYFGELKVLEEIMSDFFDD